MKLEFRYSQKDNQWYPTVKIACFGPKNRGTFLALVDSGASFSVFRAEIADYLGIKIEKGKPIYLTGIGGKILGYLHKVPVEVNGKRFNCKIVFSREYDISLNILGRDNFFLPFLITFSEREKKIFLQY